MTTLTITNTTISKLGGPGSCADAIVENSDVSYTANVASGATLVVPDSNISVNAVLQGQAVSVKPVNIQLTNGVTTVTPTSVSLVGNTVNIQVPAAVSRSTAQLMKTGQTTSYRTGDDGDIEAGRNVSFTVLAENNPFGNTNRFTDELGGQTYTKNIVIDWSTYDGSTVLGWRRTVSTTLTWNNAIDNALAVSIAPYTSGWRMPNFIEMTSISNFSISTFLNYSPFNLSASNIWCSTTVAGATASAWLWSLPGLTIQQFGKINSATVLPCRTFTVTGTTLS